MATGKKAAPKAAAPQAAEAAADETTAEVGSFVRFVGYDEQTPDEDRVLTEGEEYEVIGITEPDPDNNDPGGDIVVAFPNPDFKPKAKESDKNPRMLDTPVFPGEFEVVEAETEAEAEAVPAPTTRTRAKAAAPAPAAKTAGKPAGKPAGKTAGKPAAKTAAAAEEEPEVEDEFPELENEDPEILALIQGSEDLIATAQELESQVATTEYQIGGVLYHIRQTNAHLEVEGGEVYKENGGWQQFISDFFNIDYRKAMYLIEIYKHFTLAGIADAGAQVAQIGWTKASKIAKLLTAEEAKPDELLELARTNTVADLSTAIMEQVHVGKDTREIVKRVTLKFRYAESEAKWIDEALKAACERLGLKTIDEALNHILTEWVQEHGGDAPVAKAAAKAAGKPAAKAAAKPVAKPVAKPAAKRAARA